MRSGTSADSAHRPVFSVKATLLAALGCLLAALGCLLAAPAPAAESVYVTWAGAEPDKAACAWYIKRVIDPRARFAVVPHGAPLPEGTAFDVPQSRFRRTHNASSFQNLLREYPSDDPAVRKLALLTHDIEINLWRPNVHAESAAVEQRAREIDAAFASTDIPMTCLVSFMDNVYAWLGAGNSDVATLQLPESCAAAGATSEHAPDVAGATGSAADG